MRHPLAPAVFVILGVAVAAGCGDKDGADGDAGGGSETGAPDETDGGDGSDGTDGTEGCEDQTWYADADADGFGDPDGAVEACEAPPGAVASAGDCDDGDPAIHPAAQEICDDADVDEDCDGLADDADESVDPATHTQAWADVDADGYGDPLQPRSACDLPESGVATDDRDCDDGDAAIHPGALEVCDDAVDSDCDGALDNGCLPDDLSDAVATVAGGGGGFGHRVAGGDLTGDGIDDLVVGAYFAGAGYGGQAFVFEGPISGALVAADAVGVLTGAVSEGAMGWSVEVTADADGDGVADLMLGAPGLGGSSASSPGSAWLVAATPTGSLSLPADAFASFVGAATGANGGAYADDVGDLDGDGHIDFAIGAGQAWDLGGQTGQTYLLYGPVSGSYDLGADADATLYADDWGGGMADWLSSGDLTGDGLPDLIVPANSSYTTGPAGGAVFVVSTPGEGVLVLEDDSHAVVTGAAYDGFGQVSAVADWTGDGYADLVASDGTQTGAVYLLAGPLSGARTTAAAHAVYSGAGVAFMDRTGAALDRVDLDQDGQQDLAIGAPHIGTAQAGPGAVHVFLGPLASGTWSVSAADTSIDGVAPDALGAAVEGVGDTTGDGRDELAVTSLYRNDGAGFVWIFQ